MTKKEEQLTINITLKHVQKSFIKQFGFAPALKDMIPLEASFCRIYDIMICDKIAFHVRGTGWAYDGVNVERADVYDMSWREQ